MVQNIHFSSLKCFSQPTAKACGPKRRAGDCNWRCDFSHRTKIQSRIPRMRSFKKYDHIKVIFLVLLLTEIVAQIGRADSTSPTNDDRPSIAKIDDFWTRTLKRTESKPLNAQEELVNEPVQYVKIRVTYESLDGVKIRAYLAKPYDTGSNP